MTTHEKIYMNPYFQYGPFHMTRKLITGIAAHSPFILRRSLRVTSSNPSFFLFLSQLKHRVRRFISFPTGSVLTITPELSIPWVDEVDGYVSKLASSLTKFSLTMHGTPLLGGTKFPK